MKVVLFAGYRNSGKTTAISKLTRGLVERGKTVGTLKHIHGAHLDLDKKGKDTWLHASAGASAVIGVSQEEMIVFRKVTKAADPLRLSMAIFRADRPDYLFVEGYFDEFRKDRPRTVLCATTKEEIDELEKLHSNIVFVCGRFAERSRSKVYRGLPLFVLNGDTAAALNLIG